MDGVISTSVGYAGGIEKDPTYNNIMDHTEVLKIEYNDDELSLNELLETFFNSHRFDMPTINNQYKSLVLYQDEDECGTIREKIRQIEIETDARVFTSVEKFTNFYIAENYHQKFYLQNNIELMMEFQKRYPKFKDFVNATDSARVNGYIKGYGSIEKLRTDDIVELSEKAMNRLMQIVENYI